MAWSATDGARMFSTGDGGMLNWLDGKFTVVDVWICKRGRMGQIGLDASNSGSLLNGQTLRMKVEWNAKRRANESIYIYFSLRLNKSTFYRVLNGV